jgi:hypothetical protein
MRIQRVNRLGVVLFAAGLGVVAAGCFETSSEGVDIVVGPDVLGDVPDSTLPGDVVGDAPDGGDCPLVMGYVDLMDDPANGYHLEVVYNGQRDVRVKVTACDDVGAGTNVTFTEVEDDDNLCQLDLASVGTDADGIASVVLSSPQSAMGGECIVEACVADGNCLTFMVHVNGIVKVPLTVGFAEYVGVHPQVSLGYIRLFKKTDPSKARCDSLKAEALPTAHDGRGPINILLTAKFETLKNLDTELTQSYTVYCYATEPGSDVKRAYGCVDDVTVESGAKRYVECPLDDIPPKIVGSYDVTTTLDLEAGMPSMARTVINFIIDFVQSPTSTVLKLMCDPGVWGQNGGPLQQLCSDIFVDVANPDIANLTSIGTIAQGIIDAQLMSLRNSQCPDPSNPLTCMSFVDPGSNTGDILRNFMLLSTTTCKAEPDGTGLIATGGCTERWHSALLQWIPPSACLPTNPTCGTVTLSLASMSGVGGITADIEARLVEKNTKLAITKHAVGLKYGALIDFVMEKFLLPRMFGDGSDGLPAVDSFEAMIGALLAGRACLQSGTCCHDFAVNLVAQTGDALGVNFVEGACDSLITTAGPYIRGFLTGLDTPTSTFTFGTPVAGGTYTADQPCAISDKNGDMKFDALGGNTIGQQCLWDATVTVGGYDYSPDATFYGTRQ